MTSTRIRKCENDNPISVRADTRVRKGVTVFWFLGNTLALLVSFVGCQPRQRAEPASPQKFFEQVTGDIAADPRSQWDTKFATETYVYGREPSKFLVEVLSDVPTGRALDIAMGEGRNAVFLAKKGFDVLGVDFSDVAIRKAHRLARAHHVTIRADNADLMRYAIPHETYDLIVDINYLQRSLISQIKNGLKKGGYLVFENQTVEQLSNPEGKGINREYLLEKGELKKLFSEFRILAYRETNDGKDARAQLFAQKL